MAKIVGKQVRVVDAPGFTIDELIGGVSTKQASVSVAKVAAKAGTAEPWLTIHYDEWLCVTKGKIVLTVDTGAGSNELVIVRPGETVMIEKGTRFKPSFPNDTEYIPVCIPGFRPDLCVREDTNNEGEAVAAKLKTLHGLGEAKSEEEQPEVLYHMCLKSTWEKALDAETAYYPPTFAKDGCITHATAVASRLIATANHYYQDSKGDWVCLEFTRSGLAKRGIFVRDERAAPVGEKAVDEGLMAEWVCPHVVGGLPHDVVKHVYEIRRDGPKFVSIEGLTAKAGK